MSKKENNSAGKLKLALAGFVIMLISDIAADLTLFVKEISIINWVELGATALSWILIISALVALRNTRKEFAQGILVAVIGLLALGGEAFMVYLNIKAQIAKDPFLQMKPMFCEYVSDLAMLLVMYLLVRGCGQLLARDGEMKLAKASIRKSNLNPIIALMAMVLIPMGTVFTMPISIIVGAVGVIINGAMRIDMMNYIRIGSNVE